MVMIRDKMEQYFSDHKTMFLPLHLNHSTRGNFLNRLVSGPLLNKDSLLEFAKPITE